MYRQKRGGEREMEEGRKGEGEGQVIGKGHRKGMEGGELATR